MRRDVLIAARALPAELAGWIDEAVAPLGATAARWDPRTPPPAGLSPTLIVADLTPGERAVPPALVRALNALPPHVKLLLVAPEALVEPAITLQGGRVNLMGAPANRETLVGRVRGLLAPPLDSPGRWSPAFEPGAAGLVDWLAPGFWVGALATTGVRPSPAAGIRVARDEAGGLAIVLPTPGGPGVDEPALEATLALLRRGSPELATFAALAPLLRGNAGLVHLAPAGQGWTIYWPSPRWPLRLHSAARLPARWNLAKALEKAGTNVWRFEAVRGDQLLAAAPVGEAPEAVREGVAATPPGAGGRALAEAFAAHPTTQSPGLQAVVVEVR